jgi:hypothetical protein
MISAALICGEIKSASVGGSAMARRPRVGGDASQIIGEHYFRIGGKPDD